MLNHKSPSEISFTFYGISMVARYTYCECDNGQEEFIVESITTGNEKIDSFLVDFFDEKETEIEEAAEWHFFNKKTS